MSILSLIALAAGLWGVAGFILYFALRHDVRARQGHTPQTLLDDDVSGFAGSALTPEQPLTREQEAPHTV